MYFLNDLLPVYAYFSSLQNAALGSGCHKHKQKFKKTSVTNNNTSHIKCNKNSKMHMITASCCLMRKQHYIM